MRHHPILRRLTALLLFASFFAGCNPEPILALAAAMQSDPAISTTQLTDTVYRADGTTATGTVLVSWPAFTTATGLAVPAGNTSATIAPGGLLSLTLAPNAGSNPMGSYYTAIYHLDDGTVSREYWVVPVSATPVTIASIKSTVLPASVALQTVTKSYVDTAIANAIASPATSGTYVPLAGGTMTGPLLLPADPVSAQQAADKHYVDTSVAAVGGGSGGKVALSPSANQAVAQPTGTSLSVNRLNGVEYASQYATLGSPNGIANATASTDCTTGCQVEADPTYVSPEILHPILWPSQTHVEDTRKGGRWDSYINPENTQSPGLESGQAIDVVSTRSGAAVHQLSGTASPASIGLAVSSEALTGGSNLYPRSIDGTVPYFKSGYSALTVNGTYNTQGQHVLVPRGVRCYGVGDCLAGSEFLVSSGGFRDEADEGTHPQDIQVAEDTLVFNGTCASGCVTGSTAVTITPTSGAGTQGDGRFLIDMAPAKVISTGSIIGGASGGTGSPATPHASASFAGTSFPLSTFFSTGQVIASQTNDVAPGTVTFAIAATGVPSGYATATSSAPASTGLACVADQVNGYLPSNYEMAAYTVVDASHLQMTFKKAHALLATIAIGGLCGYGLEQTIDTAAGIRQVFPVVGSYSASGIYYAGATSAIVGQQGSTSSFANVNLPLASLVRSSNLVTATALSAMPFDLNGLTVNIAGATDSSYNGSFPVASTSANTLTYVQTGSNSSTTGGALTLLTGGFALYPMAEVLSVFDSAAKSIDGLMTLAPNNVAWANGDAVEEPHFFQQQIAADISYITQTTPRPTTYTRAGITYQGNNGPGLQGWSIANSTPASNYVGNGGTHTAPDFAYQASGVWKRTMNLQAGEQSAFTINCNSHGCGKWNSPYNLFELQSSVGTDTVQWQPPTSTLSFYLRGTSYSFSPTAFTAGTINATTLNGSLNASNLTGTVAAASLPLFGPSGATHAPGAVPDPGATAGATRYLREDGTWSTPAGGSGGGGISPTPSASQSITQPAGTSLTVNDLNAVRYAGTTFSTGSNIQAAITDAGTTGSVVIPASYTGTDAFTNPNAVRIVDLRSRALTVSDTARSLKEFGAVCNGTTDDTAAIQAVLTQSNALIGPFDTVTVPLGACRITAPLTVTVSASWFPTIVGHGAASIIKADYSSWTGTDYTAIEYVTAGTVSAPPPQGWKIGGFTLQAVSGAGKATIGFSSHTQVTGAGTNAVTYAPLVGGDIANLWFSSFSVGLDLQEMWQTHIHNIDSYLTDQLVHVHGEVVNTFFDSLFYSEPTSTAATAFLVQAKLYGTTPVQPEGVKLEGSLIFGAQTDIDIENGYWLRVAGNIFDGCTGNCVIIDDPNHIQFKDNFVYTSGANLAAIDIPTLAAVSPMTAVQGDLGDLSGNYLTGSGAANGQYGVLIGSGGTQHYELNLTGNTISNMAHAIQINKSPYSSQLRNNFFANNGAAEITVADTGNTNAVFVDGNSSNESYSVISTPSGVTGYIVGNNCNGSGTCTAAATGSVSSVAAPSASWPSWLVPSVATSTTTPSIAVAAAPIPNAALANASVNINGTACALGSTCTAFSFATLPQQANVLVDYQLNDGGGTAPIDSSGHGNTGSFPTAPAAPTWTSQGLTCNGIAGGSGTTGQYFITAGTQNAKSIMMVYTIASPLGSNQPSYPYFYTLWSNPTLPGLAFYSGSQTYGYQPASSSNGAQVSTMDGSMVGTHVLIEVLGTGSAPYTYDTYYLDGVPQPTLTNGVSYGKANAAFDVCGAPTGYATYMTGSVYRWTAWSTQLSAQDAAAASGLTKTLAQSKGVVFTPIYWPTTTPQLVATGDSLTNGEGVSPFVNFLSTNIAYNVVNYGIGNITAQQNMSLLPNRERPSYAPNAKSNISFIWNGTNDIATHGRTAQQAVDSILQECQLMHSFGFKTIVATTISRGAGNDTTTKNPINLILRAQALTACDVLSDFAGNPLVGADGANTNTTYYQGDGTHLTLSGQQNVIAPMASHSIDQATGSTLANCDPNVVTASTYTSVASDGCKVFNTASNAITDTLPSAIGYTNRVIRRCNNSLSGSNTLTIAAPSDTPFNDIAGSTSITVPNNSCKDFKGTLISPTTAGEYWQQLN